MQVTLQQFAQVKKDITRDVNRGFNSGSSFLHDDSLGLLEIKSASKFSTDLVVELKQNGKKISYNEESFKCLIKNRNSMNSI